MSNPEDLNPKVVPETNLNANEDLLSEEEMAELDDKYKIKVTPRNVSITGAAILAGALSMSAPEEAHATPLASPEAQVQPESAESVVKRGSVNHPSLGNFSFSIYYKMIDRNKPVFDGISHGVKIDGQDVKVSESFSMRNGALRVQFQMPNGTEVKMVFPGFPDNVKTKPTIEVNGQQSVLE